MATPLDLLLLGGIELLTAVDDVAPLGMAGAARGRAGGGPRILRTDDTLPVGSWPGGGALDQGITSLRNVAILLSNGSLIADSLDAFGRRWLDQLNEPGSGELSLHNADPNAAIIPLAAAIRFVLYGEVVFTMVVETIDQVEQHPDEEAELVTTFRGRGQGVVLEWALVYPARGVGALPIEQDRMFNWTAPEGTYDSSGWGFAAPMMLADLAIIGGSADWPSQPTGEGFPVGSGAFFIWATGTSSAIAPQGHCYFRKTFTAPTTGRYVIYILIDNFGDIYLDGQLIAVVNGADAFRAVTFVPIDMSAGDHTIAVHAANAAGPGINPGAVALAVYDADQNNEPISVVMVSDSTWKIVAYPPYPPGMTPGQAIIVCLTEAQDRGALGMVSWSFTELVDSAGVPWPLVGDIATKTGTDVLTFIRELSGTYIDWWMSPGDFTLHAWVKDTRGAATTVALEAAAPTDPDTGNLTALARRRE